MAFFTKLIVGLFLCGILWPAPAQAADRTYCFELRITDDRTRCAESSETGDRRACDPGSTVNMLGAAVEIWERDSGGGYYDDYIGLAVVHYAGETCYTIPWEGQPYAESEANPDLYIRLIPWVMKSDGTGPRVEGRHYGSSSNVVGTLYQSVSWRGADGANAYVANNCETGEWCRAPGSPPLVPTTSAVSEYSRMLQGLDSAQHTLEVFATELGSTKINMVIPDDNLTSGGNTYDSDTFGMADTASMGDNVNHEVGHIVHLRLLSIEHLGSNYDLSGDSWDWSNGNPEYEKAAIAEGWASYAAAVSQYTTGTSVTAPIYKSKNVETAAPFHTSSCDDNSGAVIQVTKTFWDLVDSNNEAAAGVGTHDDTKDKSSAAITDVWTSFPSGTANRAKEESGVNGRNLYDYFYHAGSTFGGTDLMGHNCTTDQVP